MSTKQANPNKSRVPMIGELILSEWIGVIAIVIGIGAMPFVGRLDDKIKPLFWVLPLATGVLVLCTGLILPRRWGGQDERQQPDSDLYRYVDAGTRRVPPLQLSVRMRLFTTGRFYRYYHQPEVNLLLDYIFLARSSCYNQPLTALSASKFLNIASQLPWDFSRAELKQAVEQAIASQLTLKDWLESTVHTPPARLNAEQAEVQAGKLAKQHDCLAERNKRWAKLHDDLAALNKQLADGSLNTPKFVEAMANRLFDIEQAQDDHAQVIHKFIEFLGTVDLPLSELPEQLAGREKAAGKPKNSPGSAVAAADVKTAGSPPIAVPYVLFISLGLLILLPSFVSLIALAGGLTHPQRIACFFSAPAIFIWIAAEGARIYAAWKASPLAWAVLIRGLLQVTGAALILAYLALSYSWLLNPTTSQAAYQVWADWLLLAGGGFAVSGALLVSILEVVQHRARSNPTSSSGRAAL